MPRKLILLDVSEFAIYTLLEELKQHPASSRIDLIPLIGSVQDRQFIKKIFDRFSPETIYHAAAYKHVPLMEQNVMQCIANNVFGTFNMAELAIAAKVKHFILVSTDKAVNPTNFMGASKRLAEIICQTLPTQKTNTCFSIVRFGNVLGSSGSVVPLFKKQIEKGGPITLTHLDVTRYFMTIPEAAQLVLQASSMARGGDVFLLDMGAPIRILDLAKRMIRLKGFRPKTPDSPDGDIAIEITGLKPGEKLYEELLMGEAATGTDHRKIMRAQEDFVPWAELRGALNTLEQACEAYDFDAIRLFIDSLIDGADLSKQLVDLTSGGDSGAEVVPFRPGER
jgi:FlaA1/EpsC-like NDP-sugar epimerase